MEKFKYKVGDRIVVRGFTDARGTIKKITDKRISVLLDSTTTDYLSVYSKRVDNRYVRVGYTMDDASYGGWFFDMEY